MAEIIKNGIGARLWRLPGQLLLALINGTAILVIVAGILALIVFSRLQTLAGDIAATMTDKVVAQAFPEPQRALADLASLMTEIHALGDALQAKSAEGDAKLEAAIVRLKAELGDLRDNIERLVGAKTLLTDEAIARIGRTVTDALKDVRGCSTATAGKT